MPLIDADLLKPASPVCVDGAPQCDEDDSRGRT